MKHKAHSCVPFVLLPNPSWPMGSLQCQLLYRVTERPWANVVASFLLVETQRTSKAGGFFEPLLSIRPHEVNITIYPQG